MTPTVIRQDSSITVISDGIPYAVSSDDERYARLSQALDGEDWDTVRAIVTEVHKLDQLIGKFGAVSVYAGHVQIDGEPVHNYLVEKILEAQAGGFPIEALSNFLDRVKRNPLPRAVDDLYRWCEAGKMPILPDGRIVAYKIVDHDFKDTYSRTFDNTPGNTIRVPRNLVDPDPDHTCSYGLHFCSAKYLPHYGPSNKKVVLVAVCPSNVVAFPRDYNLSKARCCEYEVLREIPADTAAQFFDRYGGSFVWVPDLDDDEIEVEEDLDLDPVD